MPAPIAESNHQYIVTIPGTGYRFAAEVREINEIPPEHLQPNPAGDQDIPPFSRVNYPQPNRAVPYLLVALVILGGFFVFARDLDFKFLRKFQRSTAPSAVRPYAVLWQY